MSEFAGMAGPALEAANGEARMSLRDRLLHTRTGQAAVTLMAATAFGGAAAGSAEAATVVSHGTPVVTAETHFSANPADVVGKISLGDVKAAIASDQESSMSSVTILTFNRAKGIPKKYVKKNNCEWTYDGLNSGRTVGDSTKATKKNTVFFHDTRKTKVCKVPKSLSFTGWMKAGNDLNGDNKVDAGTNCGNIFSFKPTKGMVITKNPVILFKDSLNLKLISTAHAEVAGTARCEDGTGGFAQSGFMAKGDGYAEVRLRSKMSATGEGSLSVRSGGEAATKAVANADGYAIAGCGEGTPGTTPPPVTPEHPSIIISKFLQGSFTPDGNEYSKSVSIHGNTDKWGILTTNSGDAALTTNYVDTPPQGEAVIKNAASPLGLRIVNGLGYWSGAKVLQAGTSESFEVDTINEAMPCYTNLQNTVTVTGITGSGKTVTATANAPIKENNTVDCPAPAPGQGQPVPTS